MGGQVRRLAEVSSRRKVDPEVAATLKLTAAINRATDRLGPAADAIVGFGTRLDHLCAWLKKWGPWALATVPVVASLVGGASPQVGELMGKILKGAFG